MVLAKDGYGSKRVALDLPVAEPHQFRLLADGLLGYAWPKWVRGGEQSEFRVHSDEAYKLELWRYGLAEGARPHARLVRRARPAGHDADHARRRLHADRRRVEQARLRQPASQAVRHRPGASGLYYFHAESEAGRFFSFPWIVAPRQPRAQIAVLASNITWNAYNSFGGRSNYIHPDSCRRRPTVNARLELKRYTDPRARQLRHDDYAPLSFDRPEPINHIPEDVQATDPIDGPGRLPPRAGRMAAAGWLEREGFAYDFYAETQLHFGQLDLDAYRCWSSARIPSTGRGRCTTGSSSGSSSAAGG